VDKIYEIANQYPFYQIPQILEKLMYNRLISIVHKHSILSGAQNGFRKMLSIETASQTFTESIQEALDQHLHIVGIFFDLTKPYYVLNHNTLLD
jgi:hypothetical protein